MHTSVITYSVGIIVSSLFFLCIFASVALAAPSLSAPSNLNAVSVSASEVDLSWTDNSGKEEGFEVQRRVEGSNIYTIIATVTQNTEVYSDSGLQENTTYHYRVRAFKTKKNGSLQYGGYSNVDTATTLVPVPAAPTNLAAYANGTASSTASTSIYILWHDNADNETSFEVERSTDGMNFSLWATVSANTTSISDYSVVVYTRYYYRVRAVNEGGASAYSNIDSAIIE